MLFNSASFLFIFLPIALIGYQGAGQMGRRATITWLSFISLVFYAEWRYQFVFLLVGSILVNYCFARLIASCSNKVRWQKKVLFLGVSSNLALLTYYKYLFPTLAGLGRLSILHHQFAGVLLPLGISFFTFTQIAYLIDLQQGEAEPSPFEEYVLFVTFFPHLIAGPILHHAEMMPQFRKPRFRLDSGDVSVGFTWFIMGMFKKVVLADSIAPAADLAFAHPAALSTIPAWLGVISYALQLYFDFSGYSDMAIGLARMFSIRFPLNFNSPYKAKSIIDFWSRWHMTLTRYVTAYLYNPLSLWINRLRLRRGKAVSRKGSATLPGFTEMIAMPTMISMLIIGIWHGAGLQFLIFGALHGLYISINHAWRIFGKSIRWTPKQEWLLSLRACSSVVLTMVCVLIAQVFFRADSTQGAFTMLGGMLGQHRSDLPALSAVVPNVTRIVIRLVIVWLLPNTQQILGAFVLEGSTQAQPQSLSTLQWKPTLAWAAVMTLAFIMCLTWMEDTTRFLYFQF